VKWFTLERRNATHVSTTDREARLFRKGAGKEAKLCFMGHLLMENRSGLVVATRLTQATGLAEREAAGRLIADLPGRHRITVGADRAYDTADFVAALRRLEATPHVAQNLSGRRSRIDRRTAAPPRLPGEPTGAQADRGGVRLDQNDRRPSQDQLPRHCPGRLGLHPGGRGVQPDPPAQATASPAMMCAGAQRDPRRAATPYTRAPRATSRAFAGAERVKSPHSSAAC
jgi:hypothetical protein